MLMILYHVIASKFIWISHFICNHRLLKNFDLVINMYKYAKWHHKGQQYVIGTCGYKRQFRYCRPWYQVMTIMTVVTVYQTSINFVYCWAWNLSQAVISFFKKKKKKMKQTNKQKTEEWYLARHLQRTLILEEAYICLDDHLGEQSCWYVHQDL